MGAPDRARHATRDLLLFRVASAGEGDAEAERGQRRRVELGFAGGDLTEVPAMKRVYQTDLMFQRLNVVDSRTMRLDRSVDLGFQPRAIAADYGRDLLMIGAWFTGEVHLYRLSTLAPLGVAAGLGPYLRKLSYDPERGRLYGASSCGVYQLDVTPHAGAHPESAP